MPEQRGRPTNNKGRGPNDQNKKSPDKRRAANSPRPKARPTIVRPPLVKPPKPEPEFVSQVFEQPEYVVIAQISSPFGLRGAVKATIQTDFPDRFEQLEEVFIASPQTPDQRERRPLLSARVQNDKHVVLRFEGVTKVEQAEALRDYRVSVPVTEVVPLPEGEYYIFQIIGMEVYTLDNVFVGQVVNVEKLPANDVYIVRGPLSKRDTLIPAIRDVVKTIDLEAGRITIDLLEGLID